MAEIWDTYARWAMALEYPVLGADLVRLALDRGDPARARDAWPPRRGRRGRERRCRR